MNDAFKKIIKFLRKNQLPFNVVVILLGLFYYTIRSFKFANTIPSTVWDEGMYMMNGFLFVSGKYVPYQDFGPWTNQLPFAYWLGGIPQVLFGPGLRAGRYFAVFLGLLSLSGLALAANRLNGKWWSAVVIWIVALNSGWVIAYSQVFSQGMVSFLLAWALFFLVGKQQHTRDLMISTIFFSLAGMVRVNVLPLVFVFILYAFWQKGMKVGFMVLGAGIAPILFFHGLYWPNILKFWAYWIPVELFPIGANYQSPWREVFLPETISWWKISEWWGDPTHLAWEGLRVFIDALRANFISWFGVLVSCLFIPWKGEFKHKNDKKLIIFLIISYALMFAVHTYAAIGGKTCQFSCYPLYFLFFNWIGIIGLVASSPYWKREIKLGPYLVVILLFLMSFVVFEYRLESDFRTERGFIIAEIFGVDLEILKKDPVPGVFNENPFWNYLTENFNFDSYRWLRFLWLNELLTKGLWWIIPIVIVVLSKILISIADKKLFPALPKKSFHILFLLFLSALFASNRLFSGPLTFATCENNIIDQQEQIGSQLQTIFKPGSSVFWDVKSSVPLLYVPDVRINLAQLGARFTLIDDPSADKNSLGKFGWWSISQGEEWIENSDYAIVEYHAYQGPWNWEERLANHEFSLVEETLPLQSCLGNPTMLLVFQRNQ
jgi:hypothetical protein